MWMKEWQGITMIYPCFLKIDYTKTVYWESGIEEIT